jgi:hypothetical protein
MRTRHANLRHMAHFLQTKTEPRLVSGVTSHIVAYCAGTSRADPACSTISPGRLPPRKIAAFKIRSRTPRTPYAANKRSTKLDMGTSRRTGSVPVATRRLRFLSMMQPHAALRVRNTMQMHPSRNLQPMELLMTAIHHPRTWK